MRSRFRTCLVALLAVLALSALAATAAQAAEGPFYKIAGNRLKAGEEKELKTKATKTYRLHFATFVFTCSKQKLEAGAELVGSTGANPGSSKEIIVFEGCTVEGNGTGCEVENKKITTTTMSKELVYANKERTGKILALYKPVSGSIITTIKYVGAGCTPFKSGEVDKFEGSMAAEVFSGGKAVEVGKEPAEAIADEVKFSEPMIKQVWVENEGKLEEKKPSLKDTSFGKVIAVEGASELSLAGESPWGVYTK